MTDQNTIDIGATDTWEGKTFVEKDLGTNALGMSVNSTEPGGEAPFWHRHAKLEELYIFLEGSGEFALGDEVLPVGPGSVVRAGQDVWHAFRCLPDSEVPLKWLCVRGAGVPLAEVGRDAELDKERPFPWNA
ncbi:cupin domain-containing protein [Microbacterium sp. NPDC057650]|uniref:cupin domain-containing protein n=1 Tax=unclassified Microbacterium TaxID=2609290 RepID=UPI00366E9EC6